MFLRAILILLVALAWLPNLAPAAGAAPDPANLHLASVNAAIAWAGDDELLHGKNARRQVPIASITKLMTALVVVESGAPMDEWLAFQSRHVDPAANAYTRIRQASTLQRRNMLRIALMSSENYAAYNLARNHPGGFDAFVEAMNAKARSLHMTGTEFVDPSGLSDRNRSTAADLVRLVNAAMAHADIRQYSTQGYYTASFRQPRYRLRYGNTNALVHRDSWGVSLSKTGYLDAAGRCLVMISRMQGREVITVLLDSFGSRSPMGDAGRVRRWLDTGSSGTVAGAAAAYEKRRNAEYAAAEAGAGSTLAVGDGQ